MHAQRTWVNQSHTTHDARSSELETMAHRHATKSRLYWNGWLMCVYALCGFGIYFSFCFGQFFAHVVALAIRKQIEYFFYLHKKRSKMCSKRWAMTNRSGGTIVRHKKRTRNFSCFFWSRNPFRVSSKTPEPNRWWIRVILCPGLKHFMHVARLRSVFVPTITNFDCKIAKVLYDFVQSWWSLRFSFSYQHHFDIVFDVHRVVRRH